MKGKEKPPEEIIAEAALLVGARVVGVDALAGGYTPQRLCRLRLSDGRSAVLKCVAPDENPHPPPDWTAILRREISVYREWPHFAAWQPAFLGSFAHRGWTALLIEDLSEAQRVPPWTPESVDVVARELAAMHAATLHRPSPPSKWHARFPSFFKLIRERGEHAGDIPATWDRPEWWRWLAEACAAGEAVYDSARDIAPRCFVHDDVRSDNMFLRGDRLVLIDWAQAAWGLPTIDSVCWSIGVELESSVRAEDAHRRYEAYAGDASPHALRESLAYVAGYLLNGLQVATAPAHVQALRVPTLRCALNWFAQVFNLPAPPLP